MSERALLERMGDPDWVTEEPDAHLLPHLERRCARPGSPFQIAGVVVTGDGILEMALEPSVAGDRRDLNADLFALGVLPGEGPFATHGHLVRLPVPAIP